MLEHSQPFAAGQKIRAIIFGSVTALYIAFASWSYSASLAGDIMTASVTIFLAWLLGAIGFGAFSKWRASAGFAIALAMFSGVLFYYFYQHRPLPSVEGARIQIEPADLEK